MKVKSTIPIFHDLEGGNLIYTFACFSQGGKSGAVQKCSACRGRGVRIMIRQLAPGMVQQMQSVCSDCNGEGEVINEKDRCKKCEGKKVIKEVKILEVHVDKGMKHGQRITFTGEADQAPGVEPGDIVLLLQEKEHEVISFLFYFCLRRSEMGLVCKIQVGDGFVAKSCPTLATT